MSAVDGLSWTAKAAMVTWTVTIAPTMGHDVAGRRRSHRYAMMTADTAGASRTLNVTE